VVEISYPAMMAASLWSFPMTQFARVCGMLLLLAVGISTGQLRAETKSPDWLRGTGDDLEIRLSGEVLNPDGKPATDAVVSGSMNCDNIYQPLKPTTNAHRFEIWVPVNKRDPYSMWLRAESADGMLATYKTLHRYDLRQAAIDGIRLTLQPTTRQVDVKILDHDQPVANAQVKVELGFGIKLQSKTDARGVARFGLLPQQQISQLTAWTEDHRIGGYDFDRTPIHDPNLSEYTVNLERCRDQKLRFIAEDGSPVPDVALCLQVATPDPDYNYLGTIDASHMKTDASGEAVFRWFPDWEKVHFYTDITSGKWTLDGDHKMENGVAIFKLKPRAPRKTIHGRVVVTGGEPAGFLATFHSFQGEREHHSEETTAFADAEGKFSVEVLPDITYCTYVLDSRWVGDVKDFIPYTSSTNKSISPELHASAGQEVEVFVTSGVDKKPVPNLDINFRYTYEYSWREEGETRHGVSGPHWWATTDQSGRAVVHTIPGELEVSIYTPQWRARAAVDVKAGEPAQVRLHRAVDGKQTVAGRLVPAPGVTADLREAEIEVGSIDGNYEGRLSLKSQEDGSFSFGIEAGEIGILAYTRDGKAAGAAVVKTTDSPVEIRLQPTTAYDGQLLGAGDKPAAGYKVRATARIEGERDFNAPFSKSFKAKQIDTTTDAEGNFTLLGLPRGVKIDVAATEKEGRGDDVDLEEIFLEADESRPRTVSRLAGSAKKPRKVTLADRYKSTLRDCALAGYLPIVIVSEDTREVAEFANHNLVDHDINKDNYNFMQIVASTGKGYQETVSLLKEYNWPLPAEGHVVAFVCDATGKELGRLDVDTRTATAAEQAAEFVRRHSPPPADAQEKWNAAFAEAKRTNRRVWARVSQRYCGPCFMLSRWLDDHRTVLEKDYVFVKIDDYHDQNGQQIAQLLTKGKHHGVPFHAIFDADESMLIDSASPLGNIGAISGFEGKKHLRKMLLTSRQKLTDAEVDELVDSIRD
jgi:hypothetical protein